MVEHRTVNARGAGSSPAIQAIRMWYSGCAPDSKSGDVGSNPAVLANWRVCGSDNVGVEARGEFTNGYVMSFDRTSPPPQ